MSQQFVDFGNFLLRIFLGSLCRKCLVVCVFSLVVQFQVEQAVALAHVVGVSLFNGAFLLLGALHSQQPAVDVGYAALRICLGGEEGQSLVVCRFCFLPALLVVEFVGFGNGGVVLFPLGGAVGNQAVNLGKALGRILLVGLEALRLLVVALCRCPVLFVESCVGQGDEPQVALVGLVGFLLCQQVVNLGYFLLRIGLVRLQRRCLLIGCTC